MNKNTICLWYNGDTEARARFYAETFPNTSRSVHRRRAIILTAARRRARLNHNRRHHLHRPQCGPQFPHTEPSPPDRPPRIMAAGGVSCCRVRERQSIVLWVDWRPAWTETNNYVSVAPYDSRACAALQSPALRRSWNCPTPTVWARRDRLYDIRRSPNVVRWRRRQGSA